MLSEATLLSFRDDDCNIFFLQIESEENVLICLRIIIELHKQFRPPISQEVKNSRLVI